MANSYNGWPGIEKWNDPRLTIITVPGTNVKLRVRLGDVAVVLGFVADWFNRRVEPVQEPILDDWGWAYRAVRGSSSLSNHASGTAIDLNADDHPFQTKATANFTAAQIAECGRIVEACQVDGVPVIRWLDGHDPMHWEINRKSSGCTEGHVARLADRIRRGELQVPGASAPAAPLSFTARKPRAIDWRPAEGDLIRIVQEAVSAKVDGVRGPATIAATKRMQRALRLPQDGLAGPAFVEAYLLSVDNLYRAKADEKMDRAAVRFVQWIAGEPTDGSFGPGLEQAVKEMQVWAGLAPDGNVGRTTKIAITI